MTVEVTDDGSGRGRRADGEGEAIGPQQGVSQPSAFQPEVRGFLMMSMRAAGGRRAFGHR